MIGYRQIQAAKVFIELNKHIEKSCKYCGMKLEESKDLKEFLEHLKEHNIENIKELERLL